MRSALPILNNRYDAKHIAMDLNLAGLPDPEVYKLAIKEARLLVTYNIKDFEELVKNNTSGGVIGISTNLSLKQIDKKLAALLHKSTHKSLLGKLTTISGESEV